MSQGARSRTDRRRRAFARGPWTCVAGLVVLAGCSTVAPEQRAILADPTMQFDSEAKHEAARHHATENREGSMGGTGVSGGGCGCN